MLGEVQSQTASLVSWQREFTPPKWVKQNQKTYFFPHPVSPQKKTSIERCNCVLWSGMDSKQVATVTSSPKNRSFWVPRCEDLCLSRDRYSRGPRPDLWDWDVGWLRGNGLLELEVDSKKFLFLWTHFMRGNRKSSGETSITPHKLNLIMTSPAMLIMEEFISQQMLPCGKRQFSRDPPLILLKRSVTVCILEFLNTWRSNFSEDQTAAAAARRRRRRRRTTTTEDQHVTFCRSLSQVERTAGFRRCGTNGLEALGPAIGKRQEREVFFLPNF